MNISKVVCIITIGLLFTPTFSAMTTIETDNQIIKQLSTEKTTLGNEYKGYLRVYIVEIESRWKMENRQKYHYAFLDFAYNNQIAIRYQETYKNTFNWSGDVDDDNVIIMAALFNPESHRNYADPPLGRPFDAYDVDAAAAAQPGETGHNTVNEDFTHSVFLEVGTATWCPSCPYMANALDKIYTSGDYPFYFVEMVTDMNSLANQRMGAYNLKWLPTVFLDGGRKVFVQESTNDEDEVRSLIEYCGEQDVHDLDLSLNVAWVNEGNISIDVEITNNEAVPNNPPDTPTIQGPTEGKKGESQNFTVSATDPDGDDVYLFIDWADNSTKDWIGPFSSGEQVTVNHTWSSDGVYLVKIKAKDLDGDESEWEQLKVTMPKAKTIQLSLYNWILKNIGFLR